MEIIAKETYSGTLGTTSKIGTRIAGSDQPVICVYTKDFRDASDVVRVRDRLVELGCGFYNRDGKPCAISYKPCALTYAGLNSGNVYKVNPVIYRRDDDFEALETEGDIIQIDEKEG